MRISPSLMVQKVTDNEVVIFNESSGEEIVMTKEELAALLPVCQYFFPELFADIDQPKEFPA